MNSALCPLKLKCVEEKKKKRHETLETQTQEKNAEPKCLYSLEDWTPFLFYILYKCHKI